MEQVLAPTSGDDLGASPDRRKDLQVLLQTWRLQFDSDNYKFLITSGTMEALHGVDVSWIHKPKDHEHRKTASTSSNASATTGSAARDIKKSRPREASLPPIPSPQTLKSSSYASKNSHFPGSVTPPSLSEAARESVTALPAPPTPPANAGKQQSKRPGLLSRTSSEKLNGDGKGMPRRSSWISNISSKFSSTSEVPTLSSSSPAATIDRDSTPKPTQSAESEEDAAAYGPSASPNSSKGSSFFSNLTRKLSAGQTGNTPRVSGRGGVCQRRVLNVDPNRPRCLVPELDPAKLRKVSFCVDVEIAGGPRYKDDEDDDQDRKQKQKEAKIRERAEGEALKHPEVRSEEKTAQDDAGKTKPLPIPAAATNDGNGAQSHDRADSVSPPVGSVEGPASVDKKKEKKKRSEEERKERKEKRRRRAEENGSIPVELSLDADAASGDTASSSVKSASSRAADANRPTTDPVRIYRRCCQLRETPILKRITEQLMSPTCCVPLEPGVVHCLDLTGSRLQLADMVTLGDWLAVVPVKKLLLEDADLSDEGLRCILAGLLAAKRPEPTKRRSTSPKHRMAVQSKPRPERSGIIEKLQLKNNPRVTRIGWKHISLFLYACRSIKAIDLSMIQFPATLPPSAQSNPVKNLPNGPKAVDQETDAAETFYKCLSQRPGGNKLEELIMSECGMSAPQIRKIVDGAIMCGVNRLGFAGSQLDDQGLQSVLHYLRSGVCGALDIGGNDLRDKLGLIADALQNRTGDEFWGISLSGCNLDTDSLKPLFPVLVGLPKFRFIDLSHNQDLCSKDNGTVSLLRRYIGQMTCLKRLHLSDVGMSAKQAIALADVLPEGPQLAHFNILENPQLSALASAKDEASQEEACALYASYMAAVRVSNTLICIDIDVPSSDNSEIVKALAKQVVAYSLRNMEHFALAEVTGAPSASATADAAASLTAAHGGEQHLKEIAYPDVLMHLVGHIEGSSENHDQDDPAPDDDYIVGGTGVVKALQYVLGEKADDVRRGSMPNSTSQESRTPRERPGSSAGVDEEQRGKAKKMSKNLLDSARKIRARLQPALQKVAAAGDEFAYRRLNFLDETLQSMIQRFEEEYPETRLISPDQAPVSLASSATERAAPVSVNTRGAEPFPKSDDEDEFDEGVRPAFSRHNSDVSLASRALSMEEGHLHRLGHRMRRSVVESPAAAVEEDPSLRAATEEVRMKALKEKIEGFSGPELKSLVEHDGWDFALGQIGANMNDLRLLQQEDPQAWEQFKDSQLKARMNVSQDARIEAPK